MRLVAHIRLLLASLERILQTVQLLLQSSIPLPPSHYPSSIMIPLSLLLVFLNPSAIISLLTGVSPSEERQGFRTLFRLSPPSELTKK